MEENGKRCLSCYGGCIDRLTFDMLDKEVFHHTRYVHLGVMRPQLMLDICRYCKENTNAIVSIDSGNLSRENTDMLLPYADIFIPDNKTVERTLHMSEPDACRYYAARGAKIACVTAAERGTYAYDGRTMYHVSAPAVEGAGYDRGRRQFPRCDPVLSGPRYVPPRCGKVFQCICQPYL